MVLDAIKYQNEIEWDQFMLCRLSRKWGDSFNLTPKSVTKESEVQKIISKMKRETSAETWGTKTFYHNMAILPRYLEATQLLHARNN